MIKPKPVPSIPSTQTSQPQDMTTLIQSKDMCKEKHKHGDSCRGMGSSLRGGKFGRNG